MGLPVIGKLLGIRSRDNASLCPFGRGPYAACGGYDWRDDFGGDEPKQGSYIVALKQ